VVYSMCYAASQKMAVEGGVCVWWQRLQQCNFAFQLSPVAVTAAVLDIH